MCKALVRDGSSRCDQHKVVAGSFADARRGSRHARGYGSAWDRKRKRIMERDGGLCQPCLSVGRITRASDCDHKLNKERGGTDDDDNLQAICKECHSAKTSCERRGIDWPGPQK